MAGKRFFTAQRLAGRPHGALSSRVQVAAAPRVRVAPEVLLDGRLALFHETDRWLAVADLHFGYELSQRAAGGLFPLWGMRSVAQRLEELLSEYAPAQLLVLGDLVHDRTSAGAAGELLRDLEARHCPVIFLAGNHDRRAFPATMLREEITVGAFTFRHGDCVPTGEIGGIQIIGHHHPAGVVRDGAGLRIKLPAFVQTARCWILPAFSPWAAGTEWRADEATRLWLCSPRRIFPAHVAEAKA